jgi:hypothetical protein
MDTWFLVSWSPGQKAEEEEAALQLGGNRREGPGSAAQPVPLLSVTQFDAGRGPKVPALSGKNRDHSPGLKTKHFNALRLSRQTRENRQTDLYLMIGGCYNYHFLSAGCRSRREDG